MTTGAGCYAKGMHDGLPLLAVGTNIAQAVQEVGDIMGHLVRHGILQVIGKILGEQVRIVSDAPFRPEHLVHARGAADEIEVNRDRRDGLCTIFSCTLDIMACLLDDLLLLRAVDWGNGVHRQ